MPTRLIATCLLAAALAGCQLTQGATPTPTPTLIPASTSTTAPATLAASATTAPPTPTATLAEPVGTSRDILLGGVLAWIGARGGANTANRVGQVAIIGTDGAISTLIEVPDVGQPARLCGERALSPDGDLLAFYVGGDRGSLYLMRGAAAPVRVRDVEYLACLGMGTFTFSPNGGRFAYIDYPPGATRAEFASGPLRIHDSTSLDEVASFDGAVAFDLSATDALFLRFFANGQGVADEAAAVLWDGTSEREVATLLPTDDGCRFTSGQIARAAGQPFIVMGQRCRGADARTFWQMYSLDVAAGAVSLIKSDAQPGAFVTFARNNAAFASPDGATLYFTVPDGVAAFTVAVAALSRADSAISVPVARQAVFPNFSGTANATPRFSPDGRWLTFVITSPDGDNQLAALQLDAPARAPLTLSAGSRGDTIPAFDYNILSDRLFAIAGGQDNALYDFDLNSGIARRIARGQFMEALAAAPDQIAVVERRIQENPPAELFDLALVAVADGAKRTIFTGEPLPGGGSTIAVPLAWR